MRCNRCLQKHDHTLPLANTHGQHTLSLSKMHLKAAISLFLPPILAWPTPKAVQAVHHQCSSEKVPYGSTSFVSCDTSLLDKWYRAIGGINRRHVWLYMCVWADEQLKWKCDPSLQGSNHSRGGFIRRPRRGNWQGVGPFQPTVASDYNTLYLSLRRNASLVC